MEILLESDIELDNDKIISELQKIIPNAAVIKITIRSQRQNQLLAQFDEALDTSNRKKAESVFEQFKQTLFAPDGTSALKLMRIQLAGF